MPLEVQSQCELNLTARPQTNITHNGLSKKSKRSSGCTERIRLTWLVQICGPKGPDTQCWIRVRSCGNCGQSQIQPRSWNVEIGAIEYVEDLRSEFHVGRFRELKPLIEDQIKLSEIRAPQEIPGNISECSRLWCCECRWIQNEAIVVQIGIHSGD